MQDSVWRTDEPPEDSYFYDGNIRVDLLEMNHGNIAAVGHVNNSLYVLHHNNNKFRYNDIPESTFMGIMHEKNIGRSFAKLLKNRTGVQI